MTGMIIDGTNGLTFPNSTQQVSAMAAGDWGFGPDATPPTGCVELDGSTITGGVATYPKVAARYAWMVSGADIILPDTRGKFLRGWAHGSSNDPDKATRTARVGDGQTGDYPGTNQLDAFKAHAHNVKYGTNVQTGTGGDAGVQSGGGSPNVPTSTDGGSETRPININVMYFMRMG